MPPEIARLKDIAAAAERVARFIDGVNREDFMADDEKQSAVYGQVVIIGEAANRISKEFQSLHPNLPWRKMIGMRNRIVHGYNEIDWDTAQQDSPEMLRMISKLIPVAPK